MPNRRNPAYGNAYEENTFSIIFFSINTVHGQEKVNEISKKAIDSIYIDEVEDAHPKDKVLHAEPLFIDLIRDLGARKGEHEWNLGMGIADNNRYDYYTTLLEYEFAPVDRLGLEIEVPFSFYYPNQADIRKDSIPGSSLQSLKTAAQYSFYVSEKRQMSMAVGYINEILLSEFRSYNKTPLVTGNGYNPFFIAAKRWGNNFHTLLYTGPMIHQTYQDRLLHKEWQINSNIHYMIPGTRNFIGIEFNKRIEETIDQTTDFDMTIRPQMRVSISDNLLIGIVAGIPVSRENERFSTFLRLIYEPGSKHK